MKYYRRSIVIAILVINLTCLESCSTTRVMAEADCDTFANNPVNQKTTWSFLWGLVQPADINPQCDTRFNHLNKVAVKTNLGYSLISIVTLGIVIPQHVEWCCAPYTPPTPTLGK